MTVKIQLDEDYWITSDEFQYILSIHRTGSKGELRMRHPTYHPTIKGACLAYVDRCAKASNAETLAELLVEHEKAVTTVKHALARFNLKEEDL